MPAKKRVLVSTLIILTTLVVACGDDDKGSTLPRDASAPDASECVPGFPRNTLCPPLGDLSVPVTDSAPIPIDGVLADTVPQCPAGSVICLGELACQLASDCKLDCDGDIAWCSPSKTLPVTCNGGSLKCQ
jgi:hypothetical protein